MKTNNWFSTKILAWYGKNKRDLPWRETSDPYLIWLSEIILQQTKIDQGLPYYQRFAGKYPSVHDLANATEPDIMKDWEGLGYYSRARNLHFTAQFVSSELNGKFPCTYAELIKLKGIGPYTAAAIASISSDEPVAVVDGNVYRGLSRIFGIYTPIDSTAGHKEFRKLAYSLLDVETPGNFNQAMMEFGATLCKPKNPDCGSCMFKEKCHALSTNSIAELPVKKGKTKIRNRYFNFLEFDLGNKVIIERRKSGDIWQGLYQYPLIESDSLLNEAELTERVNKRFGGQMQIAPIHTKTKHILSHQHIYATLWRVTVANKEQIWEAEQLTRHLKRLGNTHFREF